VLAYEVVSNTNPALFAFAPAVSQGGTLTYTPQAGANGTATIGVIVRDSGGTANGGIDSSVVQTFTITVQPRYQLLLPLVVQTGMPELVVSSISLNPSNTSFRLASRARSMWW
jgi:hypothetical protein